MLDFPRLFAPVACREAKAIGPLRVRGSSPTVDIQAMPKEGIRGACLYAVGAGGWSILQVSRATLRA